MMIQQDVPLKDFTTMRLGGPAKYLCIVTSRDELTQAVAWAYENNHPLFVLGGGSNVIVRDEGFDGLVVLNRIMGFDVEESADAATATFRIGAGENWDDIVGRTVALGYSGIEAMSAIPGTTGATPVQNVGAYGQEISDTLVDVDVYDMVTKGFMTLKASECGFGYRNSIFKDPSRRRYIIVGIQLKLHKNYLRAPLYDSLQRYCDQHNIATDTPISPNVIRQAVTAVRSIRLPDPKITANTGSFFKNPLVPADVATRLRSTFPDLPVFAVAGADTSKLAAGWLIENAGMKQHAAHGFTTHPQNALVVVNESATHYDQLVAFSRDLVAAVESRFGVELQQEPETL